MTQHPVTHVICYLFTGFDNDDILIAYLSELPFHAFEVEDKSIKAYIDRDKVKDGVNEALNALKTVVGFEYGFEAIQPQNWNALWESGFTPIVVDDWCTVRAGFHSPATTPLELIIEPQMAFGTGHHETTYMMMSVMRSIGFENKSVLDVGCGTGILAILAEKMGATNIAAFDYDAQAIENAEANARLNRTQTSIYSTATLESWDDGSRDIVLANINRHVLSEYYETLCNITSKNGVLILSGILREDRDIINNLYARHMSLEEERTKGDWMCMVYRHN